MEINGSNFKKLIKTTAKEYGEDPEQYNNVRFPRGLKADKENSRLIITLKHENRIGLATDKSKNINMQTDSNCFEAWAVIFYVYIMKKQGTVILDTSSDLKLPDFDTISDKNRHYCRFLYRALRFSEQYQWFEIGENLKGKVNEFGNFLKNNTFRNHIRKNMSMPKKTAESITEKSFAFGGTNSDKRWEYRSGELWEYLEEKGIKRYNDQKIYSQLRVGMWKIEAAPTNRSQSAIDLWTISDNTICAIELKAKSTKNKKGNNKVGVISEIFFYSNYMYDFFTSGNKDRTNFIPNDTKEEKKYKKEPEDSGYSLLIDPKKSFKSIAGFMLLDEYSTHPFLKSPKSELPKILEVLNDNKSGGVDIRYDIIIYPEEKRNEQ